VREDFLRVYPGAEIVDVRVGDGDANHAYVHIEYRLPSDTALREQVWLDQRRSRDRWQLIGPDSSAGTPKPAT
jgi:hypothetical protein